MLQKQNPRDQANVSMRLGDSATLALTTQSCYIQVYAARGNHATMSFASIAKLECTDGCWPAAHLPRSGISATTATPPSTPRFPTTQERGNQENHIHGSIRRIPYHSSDPNTTRTRNPGTTGISTNSLRFGLITGGNAMSLWYAGPTRPPYSSKCYLKVPKYKNNSSVAPVDLDFLEVLLQHYTGDAAKFNILLISQIKEAVKNVLDDEKAKGDIRRTIDNILDMTSYRERKSDHEELREYFPEWWCQDAHCCRIPIWRILFKVHPVEVASYFYPYWMNMRNLGSLEKCSYAWKYRSQDKYVLLWNWWTKRLDYHIHLREVEPSWNLTCKLKRRILLHHEKSRPKLKDWCGLWRMHHRNPDLEHHLYTYPHILPHPNPLMVPDLFKGRPEDIKTKHYPWALKEKWGKAGIKWRVSEDGDLHPGEADHWRNIGGQYLDEKIKTGECSTTFLLLMMKVLAEIQKVQVKYIQVYRTKDGLYGPNIVTTRGLRKTIKGIDGLKESKGSKMIQRYKRTLDFLLHLKSSGSSSIEKRIFRHVFGEAWSIRVTEIETKG
ncbi:hypothetical protein BJ508DRAFT_64825 [Ascobolus immersus RN42]|uniref:Uncharacterized protein n=1 Tax=Ascobolus immersus RN42 TaxID=1160509 RepID=A0A3N4INU1_ASCIM|nr:hypothetical protein BJ508DRAFT_64825 [Ascobolus immersus RN42]